MLCSGQNEGDRCYCGAEASGENDCTLNPSLCACAEAEACCAGEAWDDVVYPVVERMQDDTNSDESLASAVARVVAGLGARAGALAKEAILTFVTTDSVVLDAAADLEDQDGQENTCVICMDAFRKRQALRELPCKHRFHKGCIDKWLKRRAECPICKERI